LSPEEFDEFYAGSWSRLVGQLYAMTGNLAEAQDVVQEAYVRAWRQREELSASRDARRGARADRRRAGLSALPLLDEYGLTRDQVEAVCRAARAA
jgi:RNA polymerase sigma-70 factor (ECF subfamily)